MKMLILLVASLVFVWEVISRWPDHFFHLTACDVGQGDAILLSFSYFQVLIDAGPDEKVLSCLSENLPFWDKKIDVLVITHFDDDHIGGFVQLTQFYAINYLFLPLSNYKDSEAFLELKTQLSYLQKQGTIIKEPFLGQQIAFSNFSQVYQAKYNSINFPFLITFLTPFDLDLEEYKALEEAQMFIWQKTETNLSALNLEKLAIKTSDNDGSIALFVQFGELKIILLGDLESTREIALLSNALITRVDIQKVGHHGSKTSSSIDFLAKLRPETALISCGENNKFKHPNIEVLDNFHAINSQILRTDELGSIKILSDGQKFWLKNKKDNLF